tara:strand:+ start:368 stop:508 length:141 start_codon:yes stop_codon:yes gene_type:complete
MKERWVLIAGWGLLGGATAIVIAFTGLVFASGYTAGQSASCQVSLE